jgi:Zn-dependent protease
MELDVIFSIAVLVMSVVVHEVAHAVVADHLGDPTARLAGRVSLNPLRHLDIFGSLIVPFILAITHAGIMFGWAKPVPVNQYNLRGRHAEVWVSFAGPFSNLAIAVVFGALIRFAGEALPVSFLSISAMVVLINIVLAVFNLVPLPPLDGSKILFSFLPPNSSLADFLSHYSLFVLLFFVFFLWQFLFPVVRLLFEVLTGVAL